MSSLRFVLALSAVLPLAPWVSAAPSSPQTDPEASTRLLTDDPEEPAPLIERTPEAAWSTPEGTALRAAWQKDAYRFTPAVKAAYLAFAKAEARRELAASGREIPADFLAWVDGDPIVEATVYGGRHNPAEVLTVLRSLEIDLGPDQVRRKHTQLALAMAVVHSVGDSVVDGGKGKKGDKNRALSEGLGISLEPRPLLKLQIPGNPLKPVDTHPKDRPLDVNDHIINFFEGRTVEVEAKAGKKAKDGDTAPEKKTIPMAACDVIADPKLQAEFNAYMKAHGQNVEVHSGDHVVFRNSKAAVKGPTAKPVREAFQLFKTAYEAKGLLPAARDRSPTLAETFAWLARNDETPLPEGVKRKWERWPLFPLDAPWPVLTYLAQNRQPLRECEDIYLRYRDKGEFHGYGEYIGPIAQQFDMQSARRLAPYPFAYGTLQMMLKDGGVCGTMANLNVRSKLALGVPATTAGQPGHCALVAMKYEPATKTYILDGEQFVTGGPDKTTPHMPWVFGMDSGRRPMIYPMTTAWAVNYGVQSFLDSTMAWKLSRMLPEAERKAHGAELLQSAVGINPYNFLAVLGFMDAAATPKALVEFSSGFDKLLAAQTKPGCPTKGLYNDTVQEDVCKRLAELPVPSDKAMLAQIAEITQNADAPEAWLKFQTALHGPQAVKDGLLQDLKTGIAGKRTPEGTEILSKRIQATAKASPKSSAQTAWITSLLTTITGNETYVSGKKKKPQTDPCAAVILKLGGKNAEAAARAKAATEGADQDLSKDPVDAAKAK